MKKLAGLFLLFALIVSVCACGEKESPTDDFEYEMVNGEVIITEYIGTDLEVYIPSKINDRPVTTIGESAFENYDLTLVSMPDTVTTIDENAFCNCKCLKDVIFSDNLTSIGGFSFAYCESLETVTLPKNLESIGWAAFCNCKCLKDVIFSDNLTSIGEFSFRDCESLETVTLPKNLESIGSGAFSDCDSLSKVNLPDNLKNIGCNAFDSCKSLESIKIPDSTEMNITVDDYVYYTILSSPVGKTTKYSSAQGPTDVDELPTVLIVKKDSYAFKQVLGREQYGLKYEIE